MKPVIIISDKPKPAWPTTTQDYPEKAVVYLLKSTTDEEFYKIVVYFLREDGTRYFVHHRFLGWKRPDNGEWRKPSLKEAINRARVLIGTTKGQGKSDYVPDGDYDLCYEGYQLKREAPLTRKERQFLRQYRGE